MNFLENFTVKNLIVFSISFVAFIVLLTSFYANWMSVRPTEYVVIRQFGEVVRIIDEPGPAMKIPFIQSAETLSKQQMIYNVPEAEINTLDKKRMIIDNYAVWQITDPKMMIRNTRTVDNAESKMGELIYSVVRSEFGQLNYDEIISDEMDSNEKKTEGKAKTGRGQINKVVTEKVNATLLKENYGIKLLDVQMKRTDLPAENEQSVYTRMISERQTKAQEYTSKGIAEYTRILATTDKAVTEAISKAESAAKLIEAEGETEAGKIYSNSFSRDPEFYSLYQTLETYRQTIGKETRIIIPADSPFAQTLLGY